MVSVSLVIHFLSKYKDFIFKGDEFKIDGFCWRQLKECCEKASKSAGGLDNWTKSELKWTSDLGFQWLERFYRKVEETGKWPETATMTRAIFLCKDPDDKANPMSYRIIKVTSALYRLWGSVRIKDLDGWISSWKTKHMFSGIPGVGAEDCAYQTAIYAELKRIYGEGFTTGSIDVHKCFDQVVRTLVYEIARAAGIPEGVLRAYRGFLENMQVRFQLAGTLGECHKDPTSIPQGCPFSMIMIALLVRPWICLMIESDIVPRTLADDLFIVAEGKRHGEKALKAMELSRQFFRDIGAKVAPKKCMMSSTCPETRKHLRTQRWKAHEGEATSSVAIKGDEEDGKINIVNHFRDLGCHLCLDGSAAATTSTDRINRAISSLKRLKHIPMATEGKLKIIEANILSAALYGIEMTDGCKSHIRRLQAGIADVIGPKTKKRSQLGSFEIQRWKRDLDPEIAQLSRRVTLMRRQIDKNEDTLDIVMLCIRRYEEGHLYETFQK